MDFGVRSQPQMLWGKEFPPELGIDHPDHTRSPVDLPVQGFKNAVPMKKLESSEKKWLVSALPWSYADAVKKPSNRQPKQRKDNNQGEAEDSSASSTSEQEWNNLKEVAEQDSKEKEENGEESDKDTQLNPDATEFVPGSLSTIKGEEKDSSDEVKGTEETNRDETREMTEQDIKQLFLEHDNDTIDEEPADCSSTPNEEYPETEIPEGKLCPSDKLVDVSPCDQVDFCKDHFGKNELNIEPFETVTYSTEGNFTPKPDLIQDVMCKRELTKDDCVSFGNTLNFEELVKKKCTYSENHFGNNEPELMTKESFEYSDDKVEQSTEENISNEREEQVESTEDSCLDQEYFANPNDEVEEQGCQENNDNILNVISEECDSFNNPTSEKEMEFQSEEILESASLFMNLNENNEGDIKEIDEMEDECESFSNNFKNEDNDSEETKGHDDEDDNSDEVSNSHELKLHAVNEESQSDDETGSVAAHNHETEHLELENQIEVRRTQMSSENGETDECNDEHHIKANEASNSDELKLIEVEEECQNYDESEIVEHLELVNNTNIPFDDAEEEKENIYNYDAAADLSKNEDQEMLFTNIDTPAVAGEDDDSDKNAARDDMMSRSMNESTDHDSSFEIINDCPITKDDVSDDYDSKRNEEETGNETSGQEPGAEEIEYDTINTSQENEAFNDEKSTSSLKRMDDEKKSENDEAICESFIENQLFVLEEHINKNYESEDQGTIIENDSFENKEFHSESNMPATEDVSNYISNLQESEISNDESIPESFRSSAILEENQTENQENISEKDCDENVPQVLHQEETKNTDKLLLSESQIPEADVERDFNNCSQETEVNDKTLLEDSEISSEKQEVINHIENQDFVNEKNSAENYTLISEGECINETDLLNSQTRNQDSYAGVQNEATNTEDANMEIVNKVSEDDSNTYEVIELSDANGNKLEKICEVGEMTTERLNDRNDDVMTAAAITSVAVAVGAVVAAVTVETTQKAPESPKKEVKTRTDGKVAGKPLTSMAGKKPASSKPATSKSTLPSKASPVKPSSPLKSKEQAGTPVMGKTKEITAGTPVKGKPVVSANKSTSVLTASRPSAKVTPTTPNKTSQASTKTSESITKSAPTAKPAASPAKVASAKPVPSKTVSAIKPSTPPAKVTPSSSKTTTTKTVTKPTTPTTTKNVSKTVPSKPLTPTTKTASTVNKAAPTTKPPTPITKTAPIAAKAVSSKPTAAVKPTPAKPTAGVTTASPKPTKPSTPTSKTSSGETKTAAKVTPPTKPTSAANKTPQLIKKPASTTVKPPPGSANNSSVPKSNGTKVTSTTKTGPVKQPTTGPKVPAKPSAVDKMKTSIPPKPADKSVPNNKKVPVNKKVSSTIDKNAKNAGKVPAKETSKTSPELNEEETVSSTTDYPPTENGNLPEINELPPQIIV